MRWFGCAARCAGFSKSSSEDEKPDAIWFF